MENIRERIVSCAGRVWFCAKELLKWRALAMITGVPCGIIGAAFDLAVEHVTELRTEHTAILFLLPVIGLVIVAFYKAAKLEGVSTDDMIDCVKDGKPIRFWLLASRSACCWCPLSFWARCSPTWAAAALGARALLCRWAAPSAGGPAACCT